MMRKWFILLLSGLCSACVNKDTGTLRPRLDVGDFSKFEETDNIKPGSQSFVADPLGSGGVVESFYIDGTSCQGNDCQYNSVRSSVTTNIWDDPRPKTITSPKQAWYSFEIYFPNDFPYGFEQQKGSYIFTEFKESNECASFYFSHVNGYNDSSFFLYLAEFTGGRDARFRNAPEECISYLEAKVGDMDDMRGKWTRFEYYVRWSENDDGLIEVYRDGKNVLIHNGRNCRKIQNCLSRNLHYYGIYKPNNEVLSGVVPATVFYRNVSMSQTRDELTR